MSKVYTVAVLVGSLRKESINRKVAKALAALAPANLSLKIVEIGDLALYNEDLDVRPPLAYEVARYKRWHRRRVLEAKPGITGLWQVTGRSRTTFDEMVRLDLRYARSYSVWTDLKILLATPRAVISGRGAH